MIIEKKTTPEEDEIYGYPYYIARIQRQFISTKRQRIRTQYPHYSFIVDYLGNINNTLSFSWFEEECHVERFQCHFSLWI